MHPFHARILTTAIVSLAVCWHGSSTGAWSYQFADVPFDRATIFDEVTNLVSQHFLSRHVETETWHTTVDLFRQRAAKAATHEDFAIVVNDMLGELKTSHTHYYSRLDPKYYQLLGIFHNVFQELADDAFTYEGLGIDTEVVDQRRRVISVFDGSTASRSGLQYGDEIVSVDGKPFHPTKCFIGRTGQTVKLLIERQGVPNSISVVVESFDGRTMFETALKSSIRIVERRGTKIGYLHAWSYAGEQFQNLIRDALLDGELSDCDALILDLRDGWGGANLEYLNLFRPIAEVTGTPRGGQALTFSSSWNRPVALMVNRRTTSGKELLTFGFKKLRLGHVFGETTAGAVSGGRVFRLSNGDLLYLAVQEVRIDGKRLEGEGVEPDRPVARSFEDGAMDAPLEEAIDSLAPER